MSYQRLLAPVLIAALVALAGFAGGVTAAETGTATQVQQSQEAPEGEGINVTEMEVENLSTSMELESGTMVIERDGETQQIDLESATVELEEATVEVADARVQGDSIQIGEGSVMETDGTVEVQTAEETQTFDLSDTNQSLDGETIRLEDVSPGMEMGTLQGATISEMTLEGISGTASHDLLLVNVGASEATGDQNLSMVVENGDLEVENATVTLENARVEDDTLMIEQVSIEISSGTFEADRVVTLVETDLNEFTDVSQSVEDETVQQSDVEIAAEDIPELLEELMGGESMAAVTLA